MKLNDVEERGLTDFSKLPPQGVWHKATITVAEAKVSSKGSPMIAVQSTLMAEGYEGYTLFDNFLTDGSTKGGGFGKKKLVGCGIDCSQERPDEEVAGELLGKEIFVKVRHEVQKDEDPPGSGKYTKPRMDTNEKGEQVAVKKAVPLEYSLYDPSGAKKEKEGATPPAKSETPAPAQAAPAPDAAPAKKTPPWQKK